MTLGEIKIEALKLMNASYERDFTLENFEPQVKDAYKDSFVNLNTAMASDTYRDYLINMPGAINRAFAIIENKRVLPCGHITRVTGATDNETNLEDFGVPDNIAAFIPYFIKGELFREEEPGEATLAYNIFLQALDDIIPADAEQGAVDTIFGAGFMS